MGAASLLEVPLLAVLRTRPEWFFFSALYRAAPIHAVLFSIQAAAFR